MKHRGTENSSNSKNENQVRKTEHAYIQIEKTEHKERLIACLIKADWFFPQISVKRFYCFFETRKRKMGVIRSWAGDEKAEEELYRERERERFQVYKYEWGGSGVHRSAMG